jgi:hypothetical protein
MLHTTRTSLGDSLVNRLSRLYRTPATCTLDPIQGTGFRTKYHRRTIYKIGFPLSAQSADFPIDGGIPPRSQLRTTPPSTTTKPFGTSCNVPNKFIVEQSPPLEVSFTEPEPNFAKVLKLPNGPENPGKNRSQSKQQHDSLLPATCDLDDVETETGLKEHGRNSD